MLLAEAAAGAISLAAARHKGAHLHTGKKLRGGGRRSGSRRRRSDRDLGLGGEHGNPVDGTHRTRPQQIKLSNQVADGDPDQARRRAVRREHLVRPLLRDLSERCRTTPASRSSTRLPDTPSVNGLNSALLNNNPNADNPQRLSPSQALTCDQNHSYTPEQSADDNGNMDKFVQDTDRRQLLTDRKPGLGSLRPERDRDGLLRRQHRHRAVESRPALHAERQLLRHAVRPLVAGRGQRDQRRHHRRRGRRAGRAARSSTARSTATSIRTSTSAPTARRRRADPARPAAPPPS